MAIISRRATSPPSPSASLSSSVRVLKAESSNDVKSVNRRTASVTSTAASQQQNTPSLTDLTRVNGGAGIVAASLTTAPSIATPYTPHPPTRNLTETEQQALERERIRVEFYATYDVMTGVRIAATLGGFFGLMVFLIVWKSRSSSNETLKILKDPKMAAVAAVCMQEEEEREIHEAIVATGMSIYPDEYEEIVYRRQRMLSLGNVSAPPLLNRGYRFSSVGGCGYSCLLVPPRRFSYSAVSAGGVSLGTAGKIGGDVHRRSGSESSRIFSNYPIGGSFGMDDYFVETDDEIEHDEYVKQDLDVLGTTSSTQHKRTDSTKSHESGFLAVPSGGSGPTPDSRRSSAMTCCSTDSSYLERRCSAFTLGLSNLPPTLLRKLSTASQSSSIENWDYYYPDIQVIQPTPKASPCPSERSIYEQLQQKAETLSETILAAKTRTHNKTTTSKSAQKIPNQKATKSTAPLVRKHSIVSYDPDSAQAGRKQQIHSISADTVDVYPYNQFMVPGTTAEQFYDLPNPIQSAPPTSTHQSFNFTDNEELRLGVRHKIALVEVQRMPQSEKGQVDSPTPTTNGQIACIASGTPVAAPSGAGTSSSISIDSTPLSIIMDKLNGSGSLGTISAKVALFNVDKRAPLASLSSFKISSLEYQESDMRSLDGEDSAFIESAVDTDEDMQQMSSDSDDGSLPASTAVMVHHDDVLTRENSLLRAPSTSSNVMKTTHQHTDNEPATSISNKKHPVEKGYTGVMRPLMQLHHNLSGSSSDRISLLGQPMQEYEISANKNQALASESAVQPLETHFGAVICTSSPQKHPRRAQLLQQYSDPQSLPTTTTTTTTTEDDNTCSTLNTELVDVACGALSGGGGESTTHTQYSSLNTVISIGRSSPLTDNNLVYSSPISGSCNSEAAELSLTSPVQQQLQKLPQTRLADYPCASSVSDTVINTHQSSLCMPTSLNHLILHSTSGDSNNKDKATVTSKSATNLSCIREMDQSVLTPLSSKSGSAVVFELPLIKLPADDENSDRSSSSLEPDMERSAKSDESCDPSLPGSTRKWSKETLF